MTNKLIKSVLAASLAVAGFTAHASEGYTQDGSTGSVVKNAYSECWRTGYWTKENATEECDASLMPPKPAPAPAPAPVVEAPATPVAPAPVVAPAAPKTEKFTLQADVLFAFNGDKLSNEGKVALDKVIEDALAPHVKSIDGTVEISGHTDRIGSDKYNQKLSERRAESVKAYAVSKGLPADKITTQGLGKSQPVTKPEDCKGNKKTKKLIACLQPDRRVEIELKGTKSAN
ncbi:OOP family OmpA-OmpF porin [Chitinivorax tropicus]|uniref:OOP family OmpA-OmpF porin n=1 Tax=Chitinivorax tropicus TaxID=714531 RepID=A0A840MVN1_9PROT|nr:OmpA family protein [Chitinivorax tropicus]MBB5019231.1 OOP family OmpA-OmpF porin [Chitinivorax tropicus]